MTEEGCAMQLHLSCAPSIIPPQIKSISPDFPTLLKQSQRCNHTLDDPDTVYIATMILRAAKARAFNQSWKHSADVRQDPE